MPIAITLFRFPFVPRPNYWVTTDDVFNYIRFDLGCIVEVKSLKVRNTHNSAYNLISTGYLVFRVNKWNDNSVWNAVFAGNIDSANDQECNVPEVALDVTDKPQIERIGNMVQVEVAKAGGSLGAGLLYFGVEGVTGIAEVVSFENYLHIYLQVLCVQKRSQCPSRPPRLRV